MGGRSRRRPRWLLMGAAAVVCGCSSQDAEHLAQVSRKTAAKFELLTDGASGKLANTLEALRTGWYGVPLDARVSSRLHSDKKLADVSIQVRASGGIVELRGTVADLSQRRRAVELAETTLGVDNVIDALVVPES